MMDMDKWTKPFGVLSTLDAFDPFDELDHTIGRNLQWLNRPEFLVPGLPKVPQKYRITLDCTGYSPKSITTDIKGSILTVCGCDKIKCEETGDYSVKEFKKTYTLPERCECDKMVSFMTADGQLCIEFPLKETEKHKNYDLFPQICDSEDGGKCMKMKFAVPENIAPEHIHVNIKDRCLVVKAEEKKVKADGVSTFHYYKKTTLPENTNWDALKCTYNNHEIEVCAPLNLNWTPTKAITLENKQCPSIEGKKCPYTNATTYPKYGIH